MNLAVIKRQAARLGWPGALGLAALLIALGLLVFGKSLDAQTVRLQAEADGLRQQLRAQRAAGTAAQAPATPQQWQLALPSSEQRQQRLADLLEIGMRQGLVSARTEHRLSVDTGAGLERLRVTMPLVGGYAQLRGFIEAALRHDPALSLDSLRLRRASPNAAELEADLVWSLHGRSEGAPR